MPCCPGSPFLPPGCGVQAILLPEASSRQGQDPGVSGTRLSHLPQSLRPRPLSGNPLWAGAAVQHLGRLGPPALSTCAHSWQMVTRLSGVGALLCGHVITDPACQEQVPDRRPDRPPTSSGGPGASGRHTQHVRPQPFPLLPAESGIVMTP